MGIFHNDHSSHTCPEHSLTEDAAKNLVGGYDFHRVNTIVSGAFALASIVVILIVQQLHASRFANPSQQSKIMRIGMLIPFYSLLSWLSLAFPRGEVYIKPWLHLVEAFAMGSFFLLLCDYVSPDQEQREVFFATKRKDGVRWFKARWIMIFQLPIVSLLVSIVTDITAATGSYCEWGSGVHFAKFWLRLVQTISLAASILAILQFYRTLKVDLAVHRPLVKLVAFKAIVLLTFVQGIVFWILSDTGALKGSDTMTFADLNIGLPNMLICIEMLPLSLFFAWAYPATPYRHSVDGRGKSASTEEIQPSFKASKPFQGGPLGIYAWISMLDPSDTFKAIIYGFQLLTGGLGNGGYEREPLQRERYY